MKKFVMTVIQLTVLCLIWGAPALAADSPKIGVINFEKVMKESSAGKMNQKLLTAKGDELKERLKKEKDELDEINKALERESLVLSSEKKNEKEREFRMRVNDFQNMQEDFGRELKGMEIDMLNEMQKAVFDISGEIGKAEGYLMILERKNAGVIFIPDHVDITDIVIQKYNDIFSKNN